MCVCQLVKRKELKHSNNKTVLFPRILILRPTARCSTLFFPHMIRTYKITLHYCGNRNAANTHLNLFPLSPYDASVFGWFIAQIVDTSNTWNRVAKFEIISYIALNSMNCLFMGIVTIIIYWDNMLTMSETLRTHKHSKTFTELLMWIISIDMQ